LLSNRGIDARQNAVAIAEHFGVPEANDAIAFLLDYPSACGVGGFIVLAAIDFDDELCAVTREIGNEVTDRDLAAEMLFREALTQQTPQGAFGIGHVAAQSARTRHCAGWRMMFQLRCPMSTGTPP